MYIGLQSTMGQYGHWLEGRLGFLKQNFSCAFRRLLTEKAFEQCVQRKIGRTFFSLPTIARICLSEVIWVWVWSFGGDEESFWVLTPGKKIKINFLIKKL
jgi:hypothetical protein